MFTCSKSEIYAYVLAIIEKYMQMSMSQQGNLCIGTSLKDIFACVFQPLIFSSKEPTCSPDWFERKFKFAEIFAEFGTVGFVLAQLTQSKFFLLDRYAIKVQCCLSLKGQCHEIFHLRLFHRTTPPGALINHLQQF